MMQNTSCDGSSPIDVSRKRRLSILENVGSLAKVSPTKRKPYRAAYVGYVGRVSDCFGKDAQSWAAQACDYTNTRRSSLFRALRRFSVSYLIKPCIVFPIKNIRERYPRVVTDRPVLPLWKAPRSESEN